MSKETFAKKDFETCHVENLKYLKLFLKDGQIIGKFKKGTIKNYEYRIKHFMMWNNVHNGNGIFYKLDTGDFLEYLRFCYKQNYDRRTIQHRQSVMKLFFKWFIAKHRNKAPFFVNIAENLNPLTVKNSYRLGILSADEIMRMKDYCMKSGRMMELIIFVLVIDYGMTLREVGQLKKSSVDFNISENEKYVLNEVVGADEKIKRYIVDEKIMEYMRNYLIERGEDDIDNMFIYDNGKEKTPYTEDNAYGMTTIYTRIVGRVVKQSDLHKTHAYLKSIRSLKLKKEREERRKQKKREIRRKGRR